LKIADLAAKTKAAENEQIEHLRAKSAELDKEVRRLRQIIGEQREIATGLVAAVKATDPFPRIAWKSPAKSGKPIIPVLKLSDLHIGEVIRKDETEGFGAFNWDIAQERAAYIVNSFLRWVETQRYGYRIDECCIFGEGDYISGDIHRELSVTAEFPVPVQTAKAGLLIGHLISLIAPHFAKVTFHQVGADNHSRLNPKPQFKQKAQNSYSYLVHTIAAQALANHKNVEIVTATGIKHLASVNGFRFLIEHGDTVKAFMGIPWYGLERSRAREATRRMNTDKGFHYMSIAHWHVPCLIGNSIVVNGSLCGTNEFDHGCGRYAAPAQVAFMVHPEHGMFGLTPFRTEI